MGPPGCGKGTQAERLVRQAGFSHVSTGEILRREIREQTPTGREAQRWIEDGRLLPDELMIQILRSRLDEQQLRRGGILFDGFPRTLAQLEYMEAWLAEIHSSPLCAIFLHIDRQAIIERLSGRLSCPQCGAVYHEKSRPPQQTGRCDHCGAPLVRRADDRPEAVQERLEVYERQTAPVLEALQRREQLIRVDADRPPDEVFTQIVEAIGDISDECE